MRVEAVNGSLATSGASRPSPRMPSAPKRIEALPAPGRTSARLDRREREPRDHARRGTPRSRRATRRRRTRAAAPPRRRAAPPTPSRASRAADAGRTRPRRRGRRTRASRRAPAGRAGSGTTRPPRACRAGCDGPYSAIVATDCAKEVRKRTGSLIARAPRRARDALVLWLVRALDGDRGARIVGPVRRERAERREQLGRRGGEPGSAQQPAR